MMNRWDLFMSMPAERRLIEAAKVLNNARFRVGHWLAADKCRQPSDYPDWEEFSAAESEFNAAGVAVGCERVTDKDRWIAFFGGFGVDYRIHNSSEVYFHFGVKFDEAGKFDGLLPGLFVSRPELQAQFDAKRARLDVAAPAAAKAAAIDRISRAAEKEIGCSMQQGERIAVAALEYLAVAGITIAMTAAVCRTPKPQQ